MGDGFVPITKHEIRQLILTQPTSVQNYLARAQVFQKEHKIIQKLDGIKDQWNTLDKSKRSHEIEKIDKQIMNILILAKKQCRKLRIGAVEYSLALSKEGL